MAFDIMKVRRRRFYFYDEYLSFREALETARELKRKSRCYYQISKKRDRKGAYFELWTSQQLRTRLTWG